MLDNYTNEESLIVMFEAERLHVDGKTFKMRLIKMAKALKEVTVTDFSSEAELAL